ncbi:hypothetical protein PQR66_37910 [Paraburkholderia agricolaris]|uniref:Uncharacterized protein n=1 Tax=Paraburkholderia agricolaris TaxID=2152888 RepID=A0ABW9A2D7_9BURK
MNGAVTVSSEWIGRAGCCRHTVKPKLDTLQKKKEKRMVALADIVPIFELRERFGDDPTVRTFIRLGLDAVAPLFTAEDD